MPYAAAFAPYLLPGTGIFASMAGRGFGSAAANLVGQLAQEGNEGEVNPLSLLMAAGQGAFTAPGDAARGIKSASEIFNEGVARTGDGITNLDKAKNFMYKGGAKLADLAGDAKDILQNPFDEGVTLEQITSAGATPFSQASGDVVYGEAIRQKKDFERDEARRLVEEEMRQRGLDQSYIDSIIASMTAYGYTQAEIDAILELQGYEGLARGGRIGLMDGGEPDFISMKEVVDNVNADEITEGIMSANYQKGGSVLPPGMEMDYRGGGMIPMGSKERADDVPARVSKNEFVMTADAVRAAGGGSVNKGAQRMYQLMNNLEARA